MVKRKGGRITEMYAFTIVKEDGTESVMSDMHETPMGPMLAPLVFHSAALIDQVREKAMARAKDLGVTVRLIKFVKPEVIELHQNEKTLIVT
jgi:hypothetical protein